MSDHLEGFDLILKESLGGIIIDGFEIDVFDGYRGARGAILSLIDLASGSLP